MFLDSARVMPQFGRYSYIGISPLETFTVKGNQIFINEVCQTEPATQFLNLLRRQHQHYPLQCHANLPPFQGGLIGFIGYEANQYFEHLPKTIDPIGLADCYFAFYDLVIAFDEREQLAWIFSSGYQRSGTSSVSHAKARAAWLAELLTAVSSLSAVEIENKQGALMGCSNFTKTQYCQAVERAKQYILEGDIFEVNLSQQWQVPRPDNVSTFDLYRYARAYNSAPFASYLDVPGGTILSASPERFLKLTEGGVEVCPIKGTLACAESVAEDVRRQQQLLNSEKDRAENIMIVDLMRNDLSRVCEPHSVQVEKLCACETFENVHHLVSTIHGQLALGKDIFDLLAATFPPGSITGAPKIRAMEIISEIERISRGPYCGCIGYIGFDGHADLSVSIRIITLNQQYIFTSAGGAVVLDSNADHEYDETLAKIAPMQAALRHLDAL